MVDLEVNENGGWVPLTNITVNKGLETEHTYTVDSETGNQGEGVRSSRTANTDTTNDINDTPWRIF